MAYIAPPKRDFILTVVRKKSRSTGNSHVDNHARWRLEFYQLKKGDEFRLNGKIYIKINDEFARLKNGVKKVHFWPQDTVHLLKNMTKEQINERYPITQYEY